MRFHQITLYLRARLPRRQLTYHHPVSTVLHCNGASEPGVIFLVQQAAPFHFPVTYKSQTLRTHSNTLIFLYVPCILLELNSYRGGYRIYLPVSILHRALRPSHSPVHWVPGAFSRDKTARARSLSLTFN